MTKKQLNFIALVSLLAQRHILLNRTSNMPPIAAQWLKDVTLFLHLEKIKYAQTNFSLGTSFVILQPSSRTPQHIEGLNQKISGVYSLVAWAHTKAHLDGHTF